MDISEGVWENSRVGQLTVTASATKVLSNNERQIIEIVNYVLLCVIVSLFGIIANVLNLVVFYKQGLNTTINISFFAMAISDVSSLIMQEWFSMCVNPLFEKSDVPMVPSEILYISAGVPRVCCSRITFLITVYVTAERCLCITFPLHIKQIITPRRTTVVMITIYGVMISFTVPLYCTNTISWKFYPTRNKTLLGQTYTDDRDSIEGAIYVVQSIIGIISFVAVIVFTSILIRKLRQKSTWRKTVNKARDSQNPMSKRERKTMNLVVLIASILILCNIPGVLLFMTTFFEPELTAGGRYTNLFFASWSFGFLLEAINSSVNIFLYYKMSTKYRITFRASFFKCRQDK